MTLEPCSLRAAAPNLAMPNLTAAMHAASPATTMTHGTRSTCVSKIVSENALETIRVRSVAANVVVRVLSPKGRLSFPNVDTFKMFCVGMTWRKYNAMRRSPLICPVVIRQKSLATLQLLRLAARRHARGYWTVDICALAAVIPAMVIASTKLAPDRTVSGLW